MSDSLSSEQQANAVLRINDTACCFWPISFALSNGTELAGMSLQPAPNNITADVPVILCLHGYLDNCHSFIPLLAQLRLEPTYQAAQVFAVDFSGHGKSNHRSRDAHYHQSDYIQDVVDLIRQQGWSNVCIVGHSMGGIIGCSVAAILDEVVTKLLLIETVGPLTDSTDNTVKQMRASIDSRITAASKSPKHPKSFQHVLQARMQVSQLSLAHTDLIMRRNLVFRCALPEVSSGCEWGTDSRLRTLSTLRFTEEQVHNIIQNIQCPVVMVVAQDGFERVRTQAQTRSAWFKQLTVIESPGNHYVHMQYPQLITQMLTTLLSQSLTPEK
jgi:pimeloyl-ACP methyl ester carboxylesterase